jgi:hypothetical protein
MGRAERRASLARYRQEAHASLLTYMVPPDDPALARCRCCNGLRVAGSTRCRRGFGTALFAASGWSIGVL